MLEVEFVEHALAHLAQQRAGVERRECGAERAREGVEQHQVRARGRGHARARDLDRDGVAGDDGPVRLCVRADGERLVEVDLVEDLRQATRPRPT